MANPIVVAEGLVKDIGATPVLRGVSLAIRPRGVLAVMGANGAGKSTLLKVLGGIWGYRGGRLERFGKVVPRDAMPDPRIGILGHQSFLYPHLTLLENLRLYARLWELSSVEERVMKAVQAVGLEWAAQDPVRTYSRGMRQRGALARIWMIAPQLWLLDEPYSGLDEEGRRMVTHMIQGAGERGAGLVFTTHRIDEALQCADAVTIMARGTMVWWSRTEGLDRADWDVLRSRYWGGRAFHA